LGRAISVLLEEASGEAGSKAREPESE